jgi:L-alanine-DL-glutamate epimerase-like enolase superfamily enzyme
MTGAKKVAQIAESVGKMVVPHVALGPNKCLHLAASLQVAATLPEWVCPYVEYIREPPALTVKTQQFLIKEPMLFGKDGCVPVPQKPGIGVEINEEVLNKYL